MYYYDIGYWICDDATEDIILQQSFDGEVTDEIRMKKDVALKLAWEIFSVYTLEDTNV